MKNETELEVNRDDGEKIELSDLSGSQTKRKKKKHKKKKKKKRQSEGTNADSGITPGDKEIKSNENIGNDGESPIIQEEKPKVLAKRFRPVVYNDRFSIYNPKPIGKGSFGEIYMALDTIDKEKRLVALKIENSKEKINQLKIEKNVLELMNGVEGFPRIYSYGSSQDKNFLAMEMLGPNLFDLFEYCNNHFSLQTILLIAIQTITRIQDLHTRSGYIHRDIKPENFLIGSGSKSNVIYMIDFGLSKKYRELSEAQAQCSKSDFNQSYSQETKMYMEHIPYREKRQLTGTARYASINNHMGIEMSRRDDLEALGYMLIFFAKKCLPWQRVTADKKNEKYRKILEKKLSIPVEILCKDLPIEFSNYMNYVRILRFNEKPDYFFLKNIFAELLFVYYIEKFYFDWKYPSPQETPPNLRYNKDLRDKSSDISDLSRNKFLLSEEKSARKRERVDSNYSGNQVPIRLGSNINTLDIRNNKNLAMLDHFYDDDEVSENNSINKVIKKQNNEEDDDDNSLDYEEDESEEESEEEVESDATDENSFLDGNEFLSIIENNLYKGKSGREGADKVSSNTDLDRNKENKDVLLNVVEDENGKFSALDVNLNKVENNEKQSNNDYRPIDNNDYSSNVLSSEYGSNSHMISIPDDGRSFRSISSNFSATDTYQLLNTQNRKASNDKSKNLLQLGNLKIKYQNNNFNQIMEDPVEEGAISHR